MSNTAARRSLKTCAATIAAMLCVFTGASADDIDVYRAKIAAQNKPNILFVLDYSGSMTWDIYGDNASFSGYPARSDILKDAMNELLDRNFDRINAGIGSLFSTSSSGIRWPISELNADANTVDPAIPVGQFTVRDIISKQVNERQANGYTATVDALVEAAQYFRGESVTHNDESANYADRNKPHSWDTASNSYKGGNANAAIATAYSPSNAYDKGRGTFYCNDYSGSGGPNYCENKIISNCEVKAEGGEKTEGFQRLTNLWGGYQRCEYARTSDWMKARYNSPITQTCQSNTIVLISDGQPTKINDGASLQSIVGTNLSGCEDLSNSVFDQPAGTSVEGNCGIEVLESLSSGNLNPDIANSEVKTYTVGFNIDGPGQKYLQRLAAAGDGEYFQANQPQELTDALNNILDEVLGGSENFAELSIDVDTANFSHDNRVYFGLFSPNIRRAWNGNLKGYFIEPSGLTDIHGDSATTVTENGLQFSDTSQSFWSSSRDGNEVTTGGASESLISGNRKLYTFTGTSISSNGEALRGVDANLLDKSNTSITTELMGLPAGSSARESALDWIQTAPMGDPLHSKSVTVNYGSKQVVFISTNQGLLHAFDTTEPSTPTGDNSGGEELFAFMPKRLLSNLPDLEANTNESGHIYGLDGAITRWHNDTDKDGVVDSGETVLLIVGMRRGGSAYYALDVSNPDFPRLQWVLDENNPDFPALAQSWSRMSLINVNYQGNSRKLLAFAAGYDAAVQDDATGPVASSGNAIYMVDEKGDLAWKANEDNHSDMKYSIASDLTVIDSDGDSIADRLYVGDVGGQLWRVDFEDVKNTPSVTLMADLDDGGHQPFFYPPSVSLNQTPAGNHLSIAIGSGNRTNPLLNDSLNNIYVIKDTQIKKGPPDSTFSTIQSTDLYDATNNNVDSDDSETAADAKAALKAAPGWKVALRQGEKALSGLVTFEDKLLATTFEADLNNLNDFCGFETNGRFYAMDISDAKPVDLGNVLSDPDDSNNPLRSSTLQSTGIPSSPVVMFPKNSATVQIYVDKELVNSFDQTINSVYWHAR